MSRLQYVSSQVLSLDASYDQRYSFRYLHCVTSALAQVDGGYTIGPWTDDDVSMFGEQPYNLFTGEPYKFSHVTSPMLELKAKYGFGSLGFCTKTQAIDHGCKIRRGEASRYAFVEFENGKYARFYNEDQVECDR